MQNNIYKKITQYGVILALYIITNVLIPIPIFTKITLRVGAILLVALTFKSRDWKLAFFVAFVGNIVIDMLLGYGFWPHWAIGNGAYFALISLTSNQKLKLLYIPLITVCIYLLVGYSGVWIYQSKISVAQALAVIPTSLVQTAIGILLSKSVQIQNLIKK